MARPKLPDSQLKHPRCIRKSTTTGKQLDIPEPSKKEKKRWEPVVAYAMSCVVQNDRKDNIAPKTKMFVKFAKGTKPPKGWPRSVVKTINDDGSTTYSYNAEQILLWAWERKLAKYNPSMLYARLRRFNSDLRNLLDLDVDTSHLDSI